MTRERDFEARRAVDPLRSCSQCRSTAVGADVPRAAKRVTWCLVSRVCKEGSFDGLGWGALL